MMRIHLSHNAKWLHQVHAVATIPSNIVKFAPCRKSGSFQTRENPIEYAHGYYFTDHHLSRVHHLGCRTPCSARPGMLLKRSWRSVFMRFGPSATSIARLFQPDLVRVIASSEGGVTGLALCTPSDAAGDLV
jgi:hypothetical protein